MIEWVRALWSVVGERRRRWSVTAGRAHLELRKLTAEEFAALGRRAEDMCSRVAGISWVEINPFTNRLIVAHDPDVRRVDDLLAILDEVETRCGIADRPFPTELPEHPGDIEPLVRCLIELGADVAGFSLAVVGRLSPLRISPFQVDLLALLSVLEGAPRLRRLVEDRLGVQTASLLLGVSNALAQGLAQSPIGPLVDVAFRSLQAGERMAHRQAWNERAPVLCESPAHGGDFLPVTDARPAPLPPGPIEQYADVALAGSVGAFGLGVATTGSVADAAAALLGGLPRPARLGREAFAALLGRALAARGIVILDAGVLRRLDRIDCIVLPGRLLADPGADALVAAARAANLRIVVAAAPGDLLPPGIADETVPHGAALAAAVHGLQRDGRVVLLVGDDAAPALRNADCGIGLVRSAATPPWSAHILGGDTLEDARVVVEACAVARDVAHQSVWLAEAGMGAGILLAFGGLRWNTTVRVMTAVNVATLVAMANGARLAWSIESRSRPAPRRDRTPWHALDLAEVLSRLDTTLDGLTPAEAARRRRPVVSPPSTIERLGRAVVDQFANPLTPFLAVGAGLSAVIGAFADAAMVGSVMGVNALIGGVQQIRTEAAIEELGSDQPHPTRVRRGQQVLKVDATEIVPGDVLLLQAGDLVRADCRIVEADGLEVDESTLTGESLPIEKSAPPCDAEAIAERASVLYEGTAIAAGRATAVVFAAGDDTEARRGSIGNVTPPPSGVEARLGALVRFTGPAAALSGIAVAAAGLLRGRPLREVVSAGVSLAVAAVPEGLPLLATAAQLAAARRLSQRGALVRNPRAIEALGRVDVVCLDKTGTLTEGRIRLHSVSDGGREEPLDTLSLAARDVLTVALRATPEARDGRPLPHLTDRALVDGAAQAGATRGDDWNPLAEIPFDAARNYHATLGHDGTAFRLCVKGAPETVMLRCVAWDRGDGMRPLDAVTCDRLVTHSQDLARRGLRVLAVAERPLASNGALDDARVRDLVLRGFVGLSDPVRPSAAMAIDGLRRAGVRTVMITGDHPSTAESIGAELGLLDGGTTLTGAAIEAMDDAVLDALVERTTVYARVTPAHKARIVAALQRAGRVVAMTGDGANDAHAIRLANVGIALARGGTSAASVARRAADLVVTDDRIETLVDAILEGRAMWMSVRDAVAVLVGGNLGEIGFTLLAGLFGGGSPLNARQLLLVNLLTDAAPAMVIAVRPPATTTPEALLREGPEASLGSALERDIASRAIVTALGAGSAWLVARSTGTAARAGTVALISLVGAQLGQTLVTGGRSPLVLATGLGSFAALAAIVQTPGISQFFGCRPIGPVGWTIAIGASAAATGASLVMPRLLGASEPWLERARALLPGGPSPSPIGPEPLPFPA